MNKVKDDSNEPGVNRYQVAALLSPMLAVMLFASPLGLLPSLFAKYYGVSLVGLGAVLLFIRGFDSATDVLIGHFSDRYRLRYGTRRPFVLAGGLLVLPCAYFLVNPVGGEVTVFSFACWSTAFYLGYTLFNIPLLSWASELTSVSTERTFIFSLLAFFGKTAGILFYLIPFLPFFSTQEITMEVLRFSVLLGASIMLITLPLLYKYAPDGIQPTVKQRVVKSHKAAFQEYLSVFKINKPFQIYIAAYFFIGLGMGMFSGLLFMYVDVFLGLGELFAQMTIVGMVLGLALMPLCYKMAIRLGKRNSWAIAVICTMVCFFYCSILSPGEAGLAQLITIQVITAVGGVFVTIVGTAMFSDTIDYGALKMESGARGVYFALFQFLMKVEIAIGISLGLALAGWLGFDATLSQQTDEGTFAIRFAMCWLPMAFLSFGLYFIYKSPLTESRVAIIGRRLERRATRDANACESVA